MSGGRSSFDVSSRQPQPAPHDPNRPHTATQQALVTTLLFAWRRTVSSEPTGVGAAAEHHGKRVTDLHIYGITSANPAAAADDVGCSRALSSAGRGPDTAGRASPPLFSSAAEMQRIRALYGLSSGSRRTRELPHITIPADALWNNHITPAITTAHLRHLWPKPVRSIPVSQYPVSTSAGDALGRGAAAW